MTQGTFVGARLELARAFQQVTLKQLAADIRVSYQSLSFYETGQRTQPSRDVVAALAQALKVAPQFFFQPLTDTWAENECSFRRRVATPETIKKRARAHGTFIGLVIRELLEFVKLPAYNIPSLKPSSSEDIERAAEKCRVHWGLGLGPISHIGRVAEKNGAILVQHLQHADKIDAFARRGQFSVIVLNVAKASRSRWIFDVAHELGHFVLHEGILTGDKDTESQADQFAGALLLPRTVFGREFKARPLTWPHLFALKQRWSVSVAAIVYRAFELGLIDPLTYRRCYHHMSAQGWLSKGEPHEPGFVGPEWLNSAFTVAERKRVPPRALCERLGWTTETFTAVTGVELTAPAPARFRPRLVGNG
jgi:Zn-dependent peptidase ImmA (M78 family)/DNA-binding XRE family transcriptional regulator